LSKMAVMMISRTGNGGKIDIALFAIAKEKK
jgi:hypothetical protein